MTELNLFKIVQDYQTKNSNDIILLIHKIDPLLKKYARKLQYEDAYNDLLLSLIETIKKMPISNFNPEYQGAIFNYLSKSIYTSFIKQMSKYIKYNNQHIFLDDEWNLFESKSYNTTDIMDLNNILHKTNILNDNEKLILYGIYYLGYKDIDIANKMGKSRQSICNLKRRALRKLEHALKEVI